MAERCFLDTNILLYAVSRDPTEVDKSRVAQALVLDASCTLSVQVCQEFVHQATRPTGRFGMTLEEARRVLHAVRHLPIQETTLALFEAALAVSARTGYSIWDSLIVAAAQALGCNILYTEDLQDGRIIDRLRIVNPFREGAFVP
ncbi:PIN domain-containing protein [Sphingomonas nostoxanthinifaciens]|uniref:PIN domain-containing protein n=1 Tax=Sphingomonas nostoxanthinifaciens TaxID=2872652 RepID=UPI001CC1C572|nr:PIN domain-containing protein [Sphingomonas nostoxanthinifaciens]UAK24797.1 PIN domain-containing protein [Sphingomonas nostoxanthinifaciens]